MDSVIARIGQYLGPGPIQYPQPAPVGYPAGGVGGSTPPTFPPWNGPVLPSPTGPPLFGGGGGPGQGTGIPTHENLLGPPSFAPSKFFGNPSPQPEEPYEFLKYRMKFGKWEMNIGWDDPTKIKEGGIGFSRPF
jgi:hypothetical protein